MLNLQLAKKYSRAIFEIAADEKKLKEYGITRIVVGREMTLSELALFRAWRVRPMIDVRAQFLLVWAIVVPLFFQCMATKYPTYSFPAFLPTGACFPP